ADGENAYVNSHAQLAPEDEDGLRDMYDVRVGGGIAPSHIVHGCQTVEVECPGPLPPPFVPPSGQSDSGVGGGQASPLPEGHVLDSTMGKITVTRHSTKGSTLTLVVFASAAGRITVSGSGLTTARMSVGKAGTYKLHASLGARGRTAIRHHRRVRLTVHIGFSPTSGTASSGSFVVAFR
ncbi:MAG TPA: hypothetical protein VF380_08720, partial [Solirubrobacteraceae bacterium]